mmetsp:Transcript_8240/g.15080  ORF Transcript_8240/g.15080 Transcript_8240/m.15080 type:complete len:557 (-) Transcript_8240:88-1758(-)
MRPRRIVQYLRVRLLHSQRRVGQGRHPVDHGARRRPWTSGGRRCERELGRQLRLSHRRRVQRLVEGRPGRRRSTRGVRRPPLQPSGLLRQQAARRDRPGLGRRREPNRRERSPRRPGMVHRVDVRQRRRHRREVRQDRERMQWESAIAARRGGSVRERRRHSYAVRRADDRRSGHSRSRHVVAHNGAVVQSERLAQRDAHHSLTHDDRTHLLPLEFAQRRSHSVVRRRRMRRRLLRDLLDLRVRLLSRQPRPRPARLPIHHRMGRRTGTGRGRRSKRVLERRVRVAHGSRVRCVVDGRPGPRRRGGDGAGVQSAGRVLLGSAERLYRSGTGLRSDDRRGREFALGTGAPADRFDLCERGSGTVREDHERVRSGPIPRRGGGVLQVGRERRRARGDLVRRRWRQHRRPDVRSSLPVQPGRFLRNLRPRDESQSRRRLRDEDEVLRRPSRDGDVHVLDRHGRRGRAVPERRRRSGQQVAGCLCDGMGRSSGLGYSGVAEVGPGVAGQGAEVLSGGPPEGRRRRRSPVRRLGERRGGNRPVGRRDGLHPSVHRLKGRGT